jgi:hypothetical protein
MDERGTVEKLKTRKGLISRIQNLLLGGYAAKEDLREIDKTLRDSYHEALQDLRHKWERAYLEALETDQPTLGNRFKKVIQTLDRVSAQIHRGDYGYAGLMERKGYIRENELAQVLDYDENLSEDIDRLVEAIERVHESATDGEWEGIRAQIAHVSDMLLELEKSWRDRESRFRSLEV